MIGKILAITPYTPQMKKFHGNPEISFYASVFRKFTNFARTHETYVRHGDPSFGQQIQFLISSQADLLHNLTLRIRLPTWILETTLKKLGADDGIEFISGNNTYQSYVSNIGLAAIEYVELRSHDQLLSRFSGEFLDIFYETSTSDSQRDVIDKLTGYRQSSIPPTHTLRIALPFFEFNDYLPLCAIPQELLRVVVKFRDIEDLIQKFVWNGMSYNIAERRVITSTPAPQNVLFYSYRDKWTNQSLTISNITSRKTTLQVCELVGEVIILDESVRRRWIDNPTQIIFRQVVETEFDSQKRAIDLKTQIVQIPLEFNGPIQRIFFVIQRDELLRRNYWNTYTAYPTISNNSVGNNEKQEELIIGAQLQFNGRDLYVDALSSATALVSSIANYHLSDRVYRNYMGNKNVYPRRPIYCINFELDHSRINGNGFVNFSQFNNIRLVLHLRNYVEKIPVLPDSTLPNKHFRVRIFAQRLNVLRITSRQIGLIFQT